MMHHDWLGCEWDEIRCKMEHSALPYQVKETGKRSKSPLFGKLRVVRVREINGRIDFVVAYDFGQCCDPLNVPRGSLTSFTDDRIKQ